MLRDGGGCNDIGRLRWEERECLLPWVCAGQIHGGLVHAPRRDGHRMRGANRRPDQAVPDGAPESLVSQMREKLIAGLHAAFLGGAADGLYFSCRRGRAGEAPGPVTTSTPPTVGVGAALLTCPTRRS